MMNDMSLEVVYGRIFLLTFLTIKIITNAEKARISPCEVCQQVLRVSSPPHYAAPMPRG